MFERVKREKKTITGTSLVYIVVVVMAAYVYVSVCVCCNLILFALPHSQVIDIYPNSNMAQTQSLSWFCEHCAKSTYKWLNNM